MRILFIGPALLLGHLVLSGAWAAQPAGKQTLPPASSSAQHAEKKPGGGATPTFSRDQAVASALENNPGLAAVERQIEAAQARRLQADGFDPPTLFWNFEEANNLKPNRFGNQILGIEQNIPWFGVRRARKQVADLDIQVAQAMRTRARQRLTARVEKTYDRVLVAQAVQTLLAQMVKLTEEAVEISRTRFKSGGGQYVDLMRTRLRHSQLQNELRNAETVANQEQRELNQLLGAGGAATQLGDTLQYTPVPVEREIWLSRLEQEGATWVLLQRREQQAQLQFQAIRQGRYPELSLGVGRQRVTDGTNNNDAWAGRIGLTFPIPGSDRQNGLEGEALAEAAALKNNAAAQRLQAHARLNQRLDESQTFDKQLRQYRDVMLPDAEDQLQAAQQEYRVRRIDALNLLDVYATYGETRRAYVETLARYRAAITDLNTLGEDLWEIE